MPAELPLLFVDVDGVLNPYAAEACPEGFAEHNLFPGEEPVRLSQLHAQWLHELAEAFELVWGTSWSAEDRELLSATLDLPAFHGAVMLPAGEFDPREKVPAVAGVAGERPAAWIDDLLSAEAWDWARERRAPTLLVSIDPAIGLTRVDTEILLHWATDVGLQRHG
jgi:hypothetical protein